MGWDRICYRQPTRGGFSYCPFLWLQIRGQRLEIETQILGSVPTSGLFKKSQAHVGHLWQRTTLSPHLSSPGTCSVEQVYQKLISKGRLSFSAARGLMPEVDATPPPNYPMVNSWSSFPVDGNCKMKIAGPLRKEARPAQIRYGRPHISHS